jgi:DNA invertase Pin-like site-specific DNA recombinase
MQLNSVKPFPRIERTPIRRLRLQAQKDAVLKFVSHDSNVLDGEFQEVESGKNNRRVELQKAIDYCKQKGTTLLIAKLDRLSRNASFIFKLRDEKVDFVCCDIPDANTLTIGIFANLAQHERELISKRTRDALQSKKAQGFKLGKPENLSDEARHKALAACRQKALDNQNNRRATGYIKRLRDSGMTYQAVATQLNTEGFRTAQDKFFTPMAVRRLYGKGSNNA